MMNVHTSLFRYSRVLIFVGFILMSCSSGKKDMPIPLPVMTEILTEIHLGQGYFESIGLRTPHWQDSIPYNRHIVERRGYTWAQFDSTLTLICMDSRTLESVYDQVIVNLNTLSVNTFNTNSPDTIFSEPECIFPINRTRGTYEIYLPTRGAGTYTFIADIKVYPQDQMTDPLITGRFEMQDTSGKQIRIPLIHSAIRSFGEWVEYRAQKTIGASERGGLYVKVFEMNPASLRDTIWTQYAEIRHMYITFEPQKQ